MLFSRGEKAVEGQGIFSHVGVDQQGDFGVEIAECGKCRKRDCDQIADAADVENNLIGSFFEQAAAEESDHRMQVLPCGRGGVNARKAGTLFRVMRRNFVEQVNQRESRGRDLHMAALNNLLGAEFLAVERLVGALIGAHGGAFE
jgi:hypothetical protein